MGKLTDLLRSKPTENTTQLNNDETELEIIEEKKSSKKVVSPKVEGLEFDISDEDLEKVRSSVVEINTDGKNRKQIVIGMYGGIKNPKTGKRFVIPGVDFTSDNYSYSYAEMMRTLVNRPDDFKKIMNWE